jgi:hypothetical protein
LRLRGLECRCPEIADSAVNVEQWKDSPDRDSSIPWTVDEIYHKCAYMDSIVHEFKCIKETVGLSRAPSRHVHFVSHSIGVHFYDNTAYPAYSKHSSTVNLMPLLA